jgi:hypothetical protein
VRNPILPKGQFFPFLVGTFGFYKSLLEDEIIEPLLSRAGEFLPIDVEGEEAYLLNVLECFNVLNVEASTWSFDPRTRKSGPPLRKPVFHPHRLPVVGLFKIPETRTTEIYVVTDAKHSPEDDFYLWYQQKGYKSLTFKEVWSDEAENVS